MSRKMPPIDLRDSPEASGAESAPAPGENTRPDDTGDETKERIGRPGGSQDDKFDAKAFLKTVTTRPGVYRMYNAQDDIIYIGKAKNLKNRLASYFTKTHDSPKTRVLVAQIARVEFTVTSNPGDALVLEHNLIKEHRPRYNVVLRDDKSYPYVFISTREDFPRVSYQRGSRKRQGKYIGPYPNAGAVKRSLRLVQKLFRVRQCEDSYFRNRTRPCLQYQIKRCTAPCVGLVDEDEYRQDVEMTVKLLEGKDQEVLDNLAAQMEDAAAELNYERAAKFRDQLATLKMIGDRGTSMSDTGNCDYVAALTKAGQSCVQVFHVRNGINLGNNAFYPATPEGSSNVDILNAFITQFYLEHEVPREIIVSEEVDDHDLAEQVLRERAGSAVSIVWRVRGERAKLQKLALTNAEIALNTRLSSRSGMAARVDDLRQFVGHEDIPNRMECFDISHTMGEATVASCVVFNAEGPIKAEYRRFNIEDITAGDDYAAMRQALTRRYTRALNENRPLPDILFIDGGKGQLGVAVDVMQELQIDDITLVGVAKGPARRAGDETLIIHHKNIEAQLGAESPALLLVQQIRDEAHRFAIAGHRSKRARARKQSVLEEIPGLGPKRRKQLLTHFGGLRGLEHAGVSDIAAVPGISMQLADAIYETLHPSQPAGS